MAMKVKQSDNTDKHAYVHKAEQKRQKVSNQPLSKALQPKLSGQKCENSQSPRDRHEQASNDELGVDRLWGERGVYVALVDRVAAEEESDDRAEQVQRRRHVRAEAEHGGRWILVARRNRATRGCRALNQHSTLRNRGGNTRAAAAHARQLRSAGRAHAERTDRRGNEGHLEAWLMLTTVVNSGVSTWD